MTQSTSLTRSRSQLLRSLVAILCVVLILFVGAAQVLHTHAPSETVNPDCGLCVVAHVGVLQSSAPAAIAVAEAIAPVPETEDAPRPQRYFASSFYVRPPPALTSHA